MPGEGKKRLYQGDGVQQGVSGLVNVPQEEGTGRGREGEEISGSSCNKSKLRRVRDTQLARYPGLASGLGGPGKWRDEVGSGPRVETKREGNGASPLFKADTDGFPSAGVSVHAYLWECTQICRGGGR